MTKRKASVRAATVAGGECRRCGGGFDYLECDHIVPIELGGADDESNTQALCPDCHKSKTREDIRAIRKADRIKKKHERLYDPPMAGLRRGLDGKVKLR